MLTVSSRSRLIQRSLMIRWDAHSNLDRPSWVSRPGMSLRNLGTVGRRRIVEATDVQSARLGSIHFDGSISLRAEGTTSRGKLFVAQPLDVVFSRIDVRNGA